MRHIAYCIALTISLGLLAGCTSTEEKALNEQIAKEPGVYTANGLAERSEQIIKESSSLNEEQKQQLLNLHDKTRAEMAKIRFQMGKLKGTFFKTLVASNKSKKNKEIEMVKKKMTQLHNQKLSLMLGSLEEAKGILGDVQDEKIYETFMYEESPHHPVKY